MNKNEYIAKIEELSKKVENLNDRFKAVENYLASKSSIATVTNVKKAIGAK